MIKARPSPSKLLGKRRRFWIFKKRERNLSKTKDQVGACKQMWYTRTRKRIIAFRLYLWRATSTPQATRTSGTRRSQSAPRARDRSPESASGLSRVRCSQSAPTNRAATRTIQHQLRTSHWMTKNFQHHTNLARARTPTKPFVWQSSQPQSTSLKKSRRRQSRRK